MSLELLSNCVKDVSSLSIRSWLSLPPLLEQMDDPFAAPASSISGVAGTSSLGLGVPRGHKPTLSVLLRDSQLPEDDDDAADVELPSVQPLSHELFVGDDFDTSSFLLGRRHVALEEMRSEVSTTTRRRVGGNDNWITSRIAGLVTMSDGYERAQRSRFRAQLARLSFRNELDWHVPSRNPVQVTLHGTRKA